MSPPRVPRRRSFRRRRQFRRNRRGSRYVSRTSLKGFPDAMYCKLEYNETYALNGAINGARQWRANSIFDPRAAAGGNQPNYFDNYAAVYGIYTVTACRCVARIINNSATVPIRTSLLATDSNTIPTNVLNAAGNTYCKTALMTVSAGSKSSAILSWNMSTARIMGRSRQSILTDNIYSSVVTSDPIDQWYYTWQAEDTALTNNIDCTVDFKFIFTVRFTDKFNQNLS